MFSAPRPTAWSSDRDRVRRQLHLSHDKCFDAGDAVLRWEGHNGKAGCHLAFHQVTFPASLGIRALRGQYAEEISLKRLPVRPIGTGSRKMWANRRFVLRRGPIHDRQDKRIEELKRRAEELCGGQMQVGGPDECPAETEESFWNYVVDYEEAPWTTHFHQLETAGVSLPAPDSLNDQELTAKLWEVIHKLALLRVFIEQTDHLSDRELYSHLWSQSLPEEIKLLPATANSAWHIQMLGGCGEEDNRLYLKHYADDAERRQWRQDFPNDPLPVHEDLPYDRDRLLPKPGDHTEVGGEPN